MMTSHHTKLWFNMISSHKRWVCLLFCGLCAGCQTLSAPALVTCPLPSIEQSAKVQEIVPLGTPRDQAVEMLKKAGIEGRYGTNLSIFYCDTWKQNDKLLWHINVEMLFDENGEFYSVRNAPVADANPAHDSSAANKKTAKIKQVGIVDPFAE